MVALVRDKRKKDCTDSRFLGFMALAWERAYDAVTEEQTLQLMKTGNKVSKKGREEFGDDLLAQK